MFHVTVWKKKQVSFDTFVHAFIYMHQKVEDEMSIAEEEEERVKIYDSSFMVDDAGPKLDFSKVCDQAERMGLLSEDGKLLV